MHYHSGLLARQCLTILCRQAREAELELELVVVDNGGTADDRRELGLIEGAAILTSSENGGFAQGVNRGVEALQADALLIVNPDVRLVPGALTSLLLPLRAGAGVVGPRFYWDEEQRFVLPPAEERGLGPELLRALSQRSPAWARRARRQWRKQARRHWRSVETLQSFDLSGALLLIHRSTWSRVGPFDEDFRLYFEETDWLRRARGLGVRAVYEPAAVAVHDVGGSTHREPRAQAWFEESASLFRRKHYGPIGARLLERLSRSDGLAWERKRRPSRLPSRSGTLWLEVSPNREGFPAVAERLEGWATGECQWQPGPRLARAMSESALWLRVVDDQGREGPSHRLVSPHEGGFA